MSSYRVVLVLLCSFSSMAVFAALPALATDQCESRVVIFSSHSAGTSAINPHAFVCLTGGVEGIDTARITPGSDRVNVRYVGDLGAAVPTLQASIVGLGANAFVTLTRTVDSTLGVIYNQAGHTAINSLATGPITVRVLHAGDEIDRVTYRTFA
jgi:hypothetical protein